MNTNKGFSKILRELREQRNMTQKEVAEALGIERNSYGNYELGNRTPDKTMLIKLANFFDVSADYLLGRFETIQANDNRIPLLGSVPAGSPIEAIEEVEEYIDYYPHFVKHGELFGLRVTGDSMEPDIREGDIAIVEKQDFAESGDVAIVRVNGDDEVTVKKIKKTTAGIMLIPTNQDYDPLFFTNDQIATLPITIIGKVIEIRRRF